MKENGKSAVQCSLIMESLCQRLGPVDLGTEDVLQYDPYEDELQNVETLPILDENQR